MEGEPVRRHVSDAVLKYAKPVYGMFIAVRIDTNTAETFRHGIWYAKGDVKQRLDIVPLTLAQFQKYFVAMFEAEKANPGQLRDLILKCESRRDILEAPAWKQYIDATVSDKVTEITNGDVAQNADEAPLIPAGAIVHHTTFGVGQVVAIEAHFPECSATIELPYLHTRVDNAFRQFLSIIQNDPSAARMIGNEENFDLVKTLLRLITQTESLESLKKSLMELQDDNLQHLTTTLNIEKLQRVATLMADNLDNNSEEFWQTTVFKENQWVLAQIFACPCTIFSDKAYVGGKSVDNSGGNLCDFIYQNRLSQNVALIEIKTPCTEIIGNSYRGTYSFSHELSGAVNQVLNYRDNLTKSYYTLCHQSASQFEVLSPKCVVIIGKLASMNSTQIAAFESFRNSLSGVQILTFDELYQRVMDLIAILSETPSPTQHTPKLEDEGDEFPF